MSRSDTYHKLLVDGKGVTARETVIQQSTLQYGEAISQRTKRLIVWGR